MLGSVKMIVGVAAVAAVAAVATIGMVGDPAAAALAADSAPVRVQAPATVASAKAAATAGLRTARRSTTAKTRSVGTNYFAPTTSGGGVSISLSRDGRQVRHAVFAFRQTCTDGSAVYAWDPNDAIPVAATGIFKSNFDSGPLTDPTLPGETTDLVTSIGGVISKGGARIVGTARVIFTTTNAARTIKCDTGEVHFTATD
jgi:hypothetical protein